VSNRVTIEPTEFKDARTGSLSHGFRIHDEHGSAYNNLWDGIPDDDLEFFIKVFADLSEVVGTGGPLADFYLHIAEHGCSVWIGESELTWEQIKHLFT